MQAKYKNRYENSETDRDTNRRACEQTNEETDKQTEWVQAYKHTSCLTQSQKHTPRQKDTQIERLYDTEDKRTHVPTNSLRKKEHTHEHTNQQTNVAKLDRQQKNHEQT